MSDSSRYIQNWKSSSLEKYKILLFLTALGIFIIFSVVNVDANYNVSDYWIFALYQLVMASIMVIVIISILRIEESLKNDGLVKLSEDEKMRINDESISQSVRMALGPKKHIKRNESLSLVWNDNKKRNFNEE